MNLREALIAQSPSLELHRAAQREIARLDGQVLMQDATINRLNCKLLVQADDKLEIALLREMLDDLVKDAEKTMRKLYDAESMTLDERRDWAKWLEGRLATAKASLQS